jgi:hypothetical protein
LVSTQLDSYFGIIEERVPPEGYTSTVSGPETIPGTAGIDSIIGGEGNDTITSKAGNDTINAGGGDDNITAGEGSDTFIFAATATANGNDTIVGFKPGVVGVGSSAGAGDVLDFSAFLTSGTVANTGGTASAGDVYVLASATALAASGSPIPVATNEIYLIGGASGVSTVFDSPAEIAALLADGGAWDAVNIAASANAVLIVGPTGTGTSLYVYEVTNNSVAGVLDSEISLVGMLTSGAAGDIEDFVAYNILG